MFKSGSYNANTRLTLLTWTATDIFDQLLNATKSNNDRNGSLTSTAVPNGIADFTITAQLVFFKAQELKEMSMGL
jgi:hypothetical protein